MYGLNCSERYLAIDHPIGEFGEATTINIPIPSNWDDIDIDNFLSWYREMNTLIMKCVLRNSINGTSKEIDI